MASTGPVVYQSATTRRMYARYVPSEAKSTVVVLNEVSSNGSRHQKGDRHQKNRAGAGAGAVTKKCDGHYKKKLLLKNNRY